jgi:putative PIN family toxin of toxin-antitoxin system
VKVVVDTNVLYAAFVSTEGTCAQLLDLLIRTRALVVSPFILDELRRHLLAKKRMPRELVDHQIALLSSSAGVVTPASVPEDACPDPDDLPVLGTLAAAGGDCLVTGDKALRKLGEFSGHPIRTPREFLDSLPRSARPERP